MVIDSPAYPLFKEGKLKLFGLITHVGGKRVKDLDESFSDYTSRLSTVELCVDLMSNVTPVPSGTVRRSLVLRCTVSCVCSLAHPLLSIQVQHMDALT